MSKFVHLPIPFGWYGISLSDELVCDQVIPLNYFDRDLVLFRTATGQAVCLDQQCPHLGGNLAYGGRVQGDSIVCPFHEWKFNGEGICTDIPYSKEIPQKAKSPCIHSYLVHEALGIIWVWYHPQNLSPLWEISITREMVAATAWPNRVVRSFEVDTHIQETNENAVDLAHFPYVHTSESLPDCEISFDGVVRTTDMHSKIADMDSKGRFSRGEVTNIRVVTTSQGPGVTWNDFSGVGRNAMAGAITPVSTNRVKMTFVFWFDDFETVEMTQITRAYIDRICEQLEEDIKIWEHKFYTDKPMLCASDGPIYKFRRWFSQFYAEKAVTEREV